MMFGDDILSPQTSELAAIEDHIEIAIGNLVMARDALEDFTKKYGDLWVETTMRLERLTEEALRTFDEYGG